MQYKANPTIIGLFVLSAILLAIAAVFYLGGSGLSDQHKVKFILFFNGNVTGLQVGAPVTLRGVKVGQVEEMSITFESQTQRFDIPVIISIDLMKIGFTQGKPKPGRELLDTLIEQGLRASLYQQSLVTGKMEVRLDFRPDTVVRLVDKANLYPEIPTTASNMEKLASALEELPLDRMIRRVTEILEHIDKLVSRPEIPIMITDLASTMRRLDRITADLEKTVPQLTSSGLEVVNESLAMAKDLHQDLAPITSEWTQLAIDSRTLVNSLDSQISHAVKNWNETMADGQSAFQGVEASASSANELIRKGSPLQIELVKALRELSAAARSIRIMSEYLERHPEALLRGKN